MYTCASPGDVCDVRDVENRGNFSSDDYVISNAFAPRLCNSPIVSWIASHHCSRRLFRRSPVLPSLPFSRMLKYKLKPRVAHGGAYVFCCFWFALYSALSLSRARAHALARLLVLCAHVAPRDAKQASCVQSFLVVARETSACT